ncbi:protein of unknown function [Pseudomonas sp. JV241A]|nr:protein of unknown function [Pseudomonas sp. JV241A]
MRKPVDAAANASVRVPDPSFR